MAAEPDAALVATKWRAVEPLVHAPEAVHPARVRRVRMVYDAVLQRERAHAGGFSCVRHPVHADAHTIDPVTFLTGFQLGPHVPRADVAFDGSRPLLLLGL